MPARPTFLLDLLLADLAEWHMQLSCCGGVTLLPLRLIALQKPRARLGGLLRALRCRTCGKRPIAVVLLDDPADRAQGRMAAGGWRIEITLPETGYPLGM